MFSFITLLINLVAAAALIKVATTVVDLVAIKLLPQRSIYRKYKYEETLDFSDIRDGIVNIDHLHNNERTNLMRNNE